ncbi:Choline/Carnitine o-acyltransferase-domain-containing protein [Entophlyctis helioformis]|nr:Choline/Carnitine o-acyltransferase-domain-containing protein [Entophlyctis helioformis]
MSSPSSSSPVGPLYKHQASLPKLPVPSLDETLARYVRSVRPLLSDADFDKTVAAVEDFKRPGGPGETLQQRLIARDQATDKSWLIDWWNDYAYMAYRDPVVINVNYFFAFKDDKLRKNPAARAASLITGALAFRKLVVSEQLEPETARGGPLCSHQYRYLFNSTRIPEIPSDVTRNADPAKHNHVVVLRNNQFYTIETLHPNGTQLSNAGAPGIQKVYDAAGTTKDVPVGLLTTENRDVWTNVRKELLAVSPKNRASLDAIETAAFAVCLDDTRPVTHNETSRACWHGDGRNRFFDKSLQFIVFENGKAGFNGEHSMMDATPTHRCCEFILEGLAKGSIDLGSAEVSSALPAPKKLAFDLTPSLVESIDKAGKQFDAVVAKHDLRVVVFEGYGKNLIKKLQISPDAYAQMAIQLAYYKLYGVCKPTYESAQTRKYGYGRTETCRTVSTETVAWVKAMEDPTLSLKTKGELGRQAVASQTSYMAAAVDGRGVDRHLLGLRLLIKPDEPKPALFADPAYSMSCHWNLSTSQITSEYYDGYGWGEVVPDGYGIAYQVKENALHFNLVSLFLKNDHLQTYFHEALHEMRAVFEATIPAPKPKLEPSLVPQPAASASSTAAAASASASACTSAMSTAVSSPAFPRQALARQYPSPPQPAFLSISPSSLATLAEAEPACPPWRSSAPHDSGHSRSTSSASSASTATSASTPCSVPSTASISSGHPQSFSTKRHGMSVATAWADPSLTSNAAAACGPSSAGGRREFIRHTPTTPTTPSIPTPSVAANAAAWNVGHVLKVLADSQRLDKAVLNDADKAQPDTADLRAVDSFSLLFM